MTLKSDSSCPVEQIANLSIYLGLVKNSPSKGTDLLHLPEQIPDALRGRVNEAEGGHVDAVIAKVLQVKGFDVERGEGVVEGGVVHLGGRLFRCVLIQ